jgi:hypothetical protein
MTISPITMPKPGKANPTDSRPQIGNERQCTPAIFFYDAIGP